MKRTLVALALAVSLAGCGTIQNLEGAFTVATTTTVAPTYANVALNTYLGLKATADGYKDYCIANKFPQPQCSAANRRAVIRFVNAGDGAAKVLSANLISGQPLLSTTYNVLVGAINGLKTAPIGVRS
jgi:hypothetical protein